MSLFSFCMNELVHGDNSWQLAVCESALHSAHVMLIESFYSGHCSAARKECSAKGLLKVRQLSEKIAFSRSGWHVSVPRDMVYKLLGGAKIHFYFFKDLRSMNETGGAEEASTVKSENNPTPPPRPPSS